MKWFPRIIILSTLATLSHFLFTSASSQVEWLVWDSSTSLAGCSVLMAYVMYASVPYYKIGLKLFCSIYFLLCFVSPVSWVINGNYHSLAIQLTVLALSALYWFLKADKWSLIHIPQGTVESAGAYIVFRRPSNFISWIGSLFSWGIGSCYIVCDGHKYSMSKKAHRVWKTSFNTIQPSEFAFKLEIDRIDKALFREYLESTIGVQFHVINANCLTVFGKSLRALGMKPGTILPGVYFKAFLKK